MTRPSRASTTPAPGDAARTGRRPGRRVHCTGRVPDVLRTWAAALTAAILATSALAGEGGVLLWQRDTGG